MLLREAFAVLAAILVAFSLDAWWDTRLEREAMFRALEAVEAETRENLVMLERTMAQDRGVVAGVALLATVDAEDIDGMPIEQVRMIAGLTMGITLDPGQGAIKAFTEGGHLTALATPSLSTSLAGLSARFEDLTEEVLGIIPASSVVLDAAIRSRDPRTVTTLNLAEDDVSLRAFIRDAASSDEARYAANSLSFLYEVYVSELDVLRDQLEALLVLIDAEQAGR